MAFFIFRVHALQGVGEEDFTRLGGDSSALVTSIYKSNFLQCINKSHLGLCLSYLVLCSIWSCLKGAWIGGVDGDLYQSTKRTFIDPTFIHIEASFSLNLNPSIIVSCLISWCGHEQSKYFEQNKLFLIKFYSRSGLILAYLTDALGSAFTPAMRSAAIKNFVLFFFYPVLNAFSFFKTSNSPLLCGQHWLTQQF